MRCTLFARSLALLMLLLAARAYAADALPIVTDVEAQPFFAQAKRVAETLQLLGAPLTPEQQQQFTAALETAEPADGVATIQQIFDSLCLAGVTINPESRVKVAEGSAAKSLVEQGWRVYLVKVMNDAGVTAPLRVMSPNAAPLYKGSTGSAKPEISVKPFEVPDRWLEIDVYNKQPLNESLSGLQVEYRVVQLYSRNVGRQEAKLSFDVGQGTQELGFKNELNLLFNVEPAVEVVLEVLDFDGAPTTGQFVFRDELGRIYPAMTRRLAPDFFFHEQIYRHSGESVHLPPGNYQVTYSRGPEYQIEQREITVPNARSHRESFRLHRWIHLAKLGWYSGDHHVHAAGCAHYESPSEGVQPVDMMRHILGEDLNVGCVLSWGPCWYYQKQYFDGQVHKLSTDDYVMRYDVEVSGFPSSHTGHLCLLRLTEDDYPGTTLIEEWPSWDLPVLKWGKEQGGVVGFSHSGWGLEVDATSLPTYEMPKFDGIGANEYIVDVVHGACDFISAVDTPAVWELNIWYHTLNCGYQCRISGETDFPCIYGERVGLGRAYVKLPEGKPIVYDEWVKGIHDGRSYCCDGLTHLPNFRVNDLGVGEPGDGGRASTLAVKSGQPLKVKVEFAGLLGETPNEEVRSRGLEKQPYWHLERARLGDTRKVPVELIVNGQSVETREVEADGRLRELEFDYTPTQSSWVAVRVFPAAHTNPVFVEVDGRPIRASRKSAHWCLEAVDRCWAAKVQLIRDSEREAAAAAYDVAREAYRKILDESTAD